jgi:hypothetical protein
LNSALPRKRQEKPTQAVASRTGTAHAAATGWRSELQRVNNAVLWLSAKTPCPRDPRRCRNRGHLDFGVAAMPAAQAAIFRPTEIHASEGLARRVSDEFAVPRLPFTPAA